MLFKAGFECCLADLPGNNFFIVSFLTPDNFLYGATLAFRLKKVTFTPAYLSTLYSFQGSTMQVKQFVSKYFEMQVVL